MSTTITVREYAALEGVDLADMVREGWKPGDTLCRKHFTGYDPGCLICRNRR